MLRSPVFGVKFLLEALPTVPQLNEKALVPSAASEILWQRSFQSRSLEDRNRSCFSMGRFRIDRSKPF